jgi:hypothetical protein
MLFFAPSPGIPPRSPPSPMAPRGWSTIGVSGVPGRDVRTPISSTSSAFMIPSSCDVPDSADGSTISSSNHFMSQSLSSSRPSLLTLSENIAPYERRMGSVQDILAGQTGQGSCGSAATAPITRCFCCFENFSRPVISPIANPDMMQSLICNSLIPPPSIHHQKSK